MLDTPVTDLACLRAGFTNEYSVGGWFLAKNILGLWLIQQLRAKWDKSDDPWDYNRMTAEAQAAASGPIVHAVDDSLLAPGALLGRVLRIEVAVVERLGLLGDLPGGRQVHPGHVRGSGHGPAHPRRARPAESIKKRGGARPQGPERDPPRPSPLHDGG